MKNICIIVNPAAGRRIHKKVAKACRQLEDAGAVPEVWHTRCPGDATGLARKALDNKFDVIVAAGGDGTVNEVVNGMAHTDTPLALLPFGTTNLFAREIGVHRRTHRAVDAILNGQTERVHLGQAGDHYFMLMAGVGFDAHVVYGLNLRLKSFVGELAYIVSALKVIATAPPRKCIEFSVNGDAPLKCSSLILGNAKYYGGSFEVTPGANITKPQLELCAFEGDNRRSIVGYAMGVLFKRHTRFKSVTARSVEKLTVTADQRTHVQVDGDYLGKLPLEFSIVPDALTILRPPGALV